MISEDALLEKIKELSPELKKKAVAFVDSLQKKAQKSTPRVSLEGIWADMDVNITVEDIREARQEMWENFPREQFFENDK